jgi:hypothetical protein
MTESISSNDRYELALEAPVRRGTASINVRWEDKVVFDAIQAWASHRKGRYVSQWDAFSLLLGAALENEASELGRAQLFPG